VEEGEWGEGEGDKVWMVR